MKYWNRISKDTKFSNQHPNSDMDILDEILIALERIGLENENIKEITTNPLIILGANLYS